VAVAFSLIFTASPRSIGRFLTRSEVESTPIRVVGRDI
jgi:hypothetical protein